MATLNLFEVSSHRSSINYDSEYRLNLVFLKFRAVHYISASSHHTRLIGPQRMKRRCYNPETPVEMQPDS